MKRCITLIAALAAASLFISCMSSQGTVTDLGKDWEFSLDEGSTWKSLDLPHDWAFENGYSPDGAQAESGGYACGGIGNYRKTLHLNGQDLKGKKLYLDFDGVYMNSTVSVNGQPVGFRPYGYISFSYDVTDVLKHGENLIEVRVDNSAEPSARWYHGCGIYGGVRLRSENPLHFMQDGIFLITQNASDGEVEVSFETSGPYGHVLASVSRDGEPILEGIRSKEGKFSFSIPEPQLWSPQHPVLYDFDIVLYSERGLKCDEEHIRFGLKDVAWDPQKGLFLNGEHCEIHGVCEHLEGGPVGAAWTEELMRWKLGMLKEMGCNSIRTTHNPQLPFFYDICDELGLLVMDEAFDGWRKKAAQDYGKQAFDQWWERDLSAMVRRDRNHACVYIYSVGNETKGPVAPDLVRVCHENDPTRLVTSGHSGSQFMDVLGVNGHSERQYYLRDYVPMDQAFIGTETPHTWQVRGFYRTMTWYRDGFPNKGQDPFVIPSLTDSEIFGYDWTSPSGRANVKQVFNSSYDNATVRLTARHNIAIARDLDWYSGNYRWTGFDYLGEAGFVHGGWPFRAFMGGVIDMAGFPKDHYYLYQSEWNPDIDMVHILPSWTHPDMEEGTLIPVWAYTTGDEVELFLNGNSLGRVAKGREWDKIQCQWMVPWTPGCIEAVAYRSGVEIAREKVNTAGEPADFTTEAKDGMLTFTQVDADGNMCPYGDSRVFVSLPTGTRVLSFENGNPVDDETNVGADSRRCFFGLCRAFVSEDAEKALKGMTAGMICCDRSMKTSAKARIAVHGNGAFTVRYTLDGSRPDKSSALYEGAFDVEPGMVIRAIVVKGGKEVLEMKEEMTGGMYGGKPGEPAFEGKKLEFSEDGLIEWYQENDGGERDAAVRIAWTCKGKSKVELINNGKSVAVIDLPSTLFFPDNVSTMIKLHQGANQMSLRLLEFEGSEKPLIERIDVL